LDLVENPNLKESNISHPWEYARFVFIKDIFNTLIREEDYLLDMGSGDGFVLSQIQRSNKKINFIGVDKYYNSNQINKLKSRLKSDHIYNKIESVEIGESKVTIVLLLDVLEHIKDPKKILNDLVKNIFIDKECKLIITVPAFQSLFTAHDKYLGHYKRYNLKSIEKLIKSCGFIILDKGYFFYSILIIRILEKLAEIFFKYDNSNKVSQNFKHKFFRSLIKNIMISENLIFKKIKNITGINFPGLSLYIVCQIQQ